MTHPARPSAVRRPSAFTLVEVLVGILILGLGLLGLGAIYPAVAIQQRGASDAVEGQAVADAAESYFRGNGWLNQRSVAPALNGNPRTIQGWEAALFADNGGRGRGWGSIENQGTQLIQLDDTSGIIRIGAQTVTGGEADLPTTGFGGEIAIDVFDRLTPHIEPEPGSAFRDARFVWDAAARRLDRRSPLTPPPTGRPLREAIQDAVQVAVFIRRLDPGIRNRTGQAYVPVAQTAQGLAALDGIGSRTVGGSGTPNYAPIRRTEVMPWADAFPGGVIPPGAMIRYVVLSDTAPTSTGMTADNVDAALGQVGQKFAFSPRATVATFVVHVGSVERRSVGGNSRNVLRIDPEVPYEAFAPASGSPGLTTLFTAQPPVAVRVVTLRDGGTN